MMEHNYYQAPATCDLVPAQSVAPETNHNNRLAKPNADINSGVFVSQEHNHINYHAQFNNYHNNHMIDLDHMTRNQTTTSQPKVLQTTKQSKGCYENETQDFADVSSSTFNYGSRDPTFCRYDNVHMSSQATDNRQHQSQCFHHHHDINQRTPHPIDQYYNYQPNHQHNTDQQNMTNTSSQYPHQQYYCKNEPSNSFNQATTMAYNNQATNQQQYHHQQFFPTYNNVPDFSNIIATNEYNGTPSIEPTLAMSSLQSLHNQSTLDSTIADLGKQTGDTNFVTPTTTYQPYEHQRNENYRHNEFDQQLSNVNNRYQSAILSENDTIYNHNQADYANNNYQYSYDYHKQPNQQQRLPGEVVDKNDHLSAWTNDRYRCLSPSRTKVTTTGVGEFPRASIASDKPLNTSSSHLNSTSFETNNNQVPIKVEAVVNSDSHYNSPELDKSSSSSDSTCSMNDSIGLLGQNESASSSPQANKQQQVTDASSASAVRSNKCSICGRNYARPSTLKTHLRTHTNERPFQCAICKKTFSQAANLTAHQRVHTGERPFSCPLCGRQFSQSSSVITHLRTHSGERPYRCNICNRTFSDSSTLTKHCRIHSGEKPYQCNYCPLNFSQSGNLSRHLKLHFITPSSGTSSSSSSSTTSSTGNGTTTSIHQHQHLQRQQHHDNIPTQLSSANSSFIKTNAIEHRTSSTSSNSRASIGL